MPDSTETYRLYIDESGDHVMKDEVTLSRESHRYLCLAGCWMVTKAYVKFHEDLEHLKQNHFPRHPDEPPVILHREDIIACRRGFWRLRDPAQRQAFDADLLQLISDTDFTVTGVVVDKLALKQKYAYPFHPYHMALDYLLQRYCGVLNHRSRRGDAMAESRGGREDRELAEAFTRIWETADMHHDPSFFQQALTSKEIKLKKKEANIAGLQLADLLANPVCRYALQKCQATDEEATEYEKRIFAVIEGKFNRNLQNGAVKGYGWVLYPQK